MARKNKQADGSEAKQKASVGAADAMRSDPVRMAGLIAHQLQSPLNAVSAALQAVLSEYTGPLSPGQRGSLERANARCDESISTIRRMLRISRAAAETAPAETVTDLGAALRACQARYAADTYSREITFELLVPGEVLYVHMDEAGLAEVLNALVGNSLKYTPDGGSIRIKISPDSAGELITLAVADSGIGIPEAEAGRIFEPFYRTSTSQATASGIGLGLAFVKSVVESYGGKVRVNGSSQLGGAEFILELRAARKPENDEGHARQLRVVVIGGVTAGPKAAARIIRQCPDADVTIVDRGTVLSYAGCGLPFYVSGVVRDQKRLISSPAGVVRDPVFFRSVKSVEVLNQTEAVEIDRQQRRVRVRELISGNERWLEYDKLVLATGARAFIPPDLSTQLRNVFTLHGVRDAEGIRAALSEQKSHDTVIIGGGLIGVEMTEALTRRGARVTIIEAMPRILAILDEEMALLVERHLEAHGVRVMTGCRAYGYSGEEAVSGIETAQGLIPANMVILATGIQPETELAQRAGLQLGASGALRVNERMQTSDSDIYAAGDCVEALHRVTRKQCYIPLGSTASKQGRVAAANLCSGSDVFPGVLGTSICTIFEFTVVRCGLGEKDAQREGLSVSSVIVAGPDRTHFMPQARPAVIKLIVETSSRRLVGMQGVGRGALDKRLDVAAMAITEGWTVDQLAHADLGYTPSFSSDLDLIMTAANVMRNKLDGSLHSLKPAELQARLEAREELLLVDVRTPAEYEQARLPGAQSLPLGSLRGRVADIPVDVPIVVYCDIGLRSYEASLILQAAGRAKVDVLEGGLQAWPFGLVE